MPSYYFDDCVLDEGRRVLWVRGAPVDVQPLVFDMLLHFVRKPGVVVSKDELLSAVWRSAHVSESVIARVIMKARRAIEDNAAGPTKIVTVRSVGYRFDAALRSAADPVPSALANGAVSTRGGSHGLDLAVLPLANDTGDPSLQWLEFGLAGVIHQRLASSGKLQLVSMEAIAAWRPGDVTADDELALACSQLGSTKALLCRIERRGARVQASLRLGATTEDAFSDVYEADDLMGLADLITRVAFADLLAEEAVVAVVGANEGLLARAMDLVRIGRFAESRALLAEYQRHAGISMHTRLCLAQILFSCSHFDESIVEAEAALASAESAGEPDVQAQCLALLALGYCEQIRVEESQARIAAGQTLIMRGGLSPGSLLALHLARARVCRLLSQIPEALSSLERALFAARSLGDKYAEAACRRGIGFALIVDGTDPAGAIKALTHAIKLARIGRFVRVEVDAMADLSAAYTMSRQLDSAMATIHRALPLAESTGNEYMANVLKAQLIETHFDRGEFDESRAALREHLGKLAREDVASYQLWHSYMEAKLQWVEGFPQRALSLLRELVAGLPPGVRAFVGGDTPQALCILWCISLGKIADAQSLLEQYSGAIGTGAVARCDAALALHRGDRVAAKESLRLAWQSVLPNTDVGIDLACDLAWLLLEDGDLTEADGVLAALNDVPIGYPPVAIVRTRAASAPCPVTDPVAARKLRLLVTQAWCTHRAAAEVEAN